MVSDNLFQPIYTGGLTTSVTTSAQAVVLDAKATSVCLTNLDGGTVYVRIGPTDVVDGGGYAVMLGMQVVIAKPEGETRMTVIGEAVGSLHSVCGRGI